MPIFFDEPTVARLCKLVHEAYHEGWDDGSSYMASYYRGEETDPVHAYWGNSDVRQALGDLGSQCAEE